MLYIPYRLYDKDKIYDEEEDNVDLVLGMIGVAVQVALRMIAIWLVVDILDGYVRSLPLPPF